MPDRPHRTLFTARLWSALGSLEAEEAAELVGELFRQFIAETAEEDERSLLETAAQQRDAAAAELRNLADWLVEIGNPGDLVELLWPGHLPGDDNSWTAAAFLNERLANLGTEVESLGLKIAGLEWPKDGELQRWGRQRYAELRNRNQHQKREVQDRRNVVSSGPDHRRVESPRPATLTKSRPPDPTLKTHRPEALQFVVAARDLLAVAHFLECAEGPTALVATARRLGGRIRRLAALVRNAGDSEDSLSAKKVDGSDEADAPPWQGAVLVALESLLEVEESLTQVRFTALEMVQAEGQQAASSTHSADTEDADASGNTRGGAWEVLGILDHCLHPKGPIAGVRQALGQLLENREGTDHSSSQIEKE